MITRLRIMKVLFVALLLSVSPVKAQQNLGPNPRIGGIPMVCGGAITVVMPMGAIGDIARAMPGQILLDARFFQLPPLVQRFIWGHECGHQMGADEAGADCIAVTFGKRQGWLSPAGLVQVQQLLASSSGDWTHMPGPQRIQWLAACYAQA